MFKKKEVISAFDIEGSLVKLAQIGIDDTRRLHRLAARKAASDSADDLVKTIRALANEHNVSETRIFAILPRHKVTVKNFKLPSTNPSEIENMVTLQAAKQLPFLPDKIISGYKIVEKDKSGYSNVMAVLAHRDIIDNTLKLYNLAGLSIEKLALSSEALALGYLESQKEDEKKTCICLVDIGSSVVEIQFLREGILDFTRSISFPSPSAMEEKMADEVRKSLFTYQKTFSGFEAKRVVLTGRRSVVDKEAPALKESLGLPTVYVDTLKVLPKIEDAALPAEEELSSDTFTAVLSLGFNYNKVQTNLIPRETRLKAVSKIIKESLMMSGVLFLCVLLGVVGISTKNFIDKKRYLAEINSRLAEIEPMVENLSRLDEATAVIKKQLDIKGSSIDIIRELHNKIPPEIALTILDYEDGKTCLLRGTSQTLSDVFKFISILEDSDYFENVKVRYATKRVIARKEYTDFEIACQLTQVNTK